MNHPQLQLFLVHPWLSRKLILAEWKSYFHGIPKRQTNGIGVQRPRQWNQAHYELYFHHIDLTLTRPHPAVADVFRVNRSVGAWPVELQSSWPATARCWRVPRSKPLKGCSVPWNPEKNHESTKHWAGQRLPLFIFPIRVFLHSLIVWQILMNGNGKRSHKIAEAARKWWPAYWHSFHCSSVDVEPAKTGWLGWVQPMPILTTANCWAWSQAKQGITQMLIWVFSKIGVPPNHPFFIGFPL